MTAGPTVNLPPHLAAATYARLASAGLLSPDIAEAAKADCDIRAAISACGRNARLQRPAHAPPQDVAARRRAAETLRVTLQCLLQSQASRSTLLKTTKKLAAPALTKREVDSIVQQQIARHLRSARVASSITSMAERSLPAEHAGAVNAAA